jgi:hypothetical protein
MDVAARVELLSTDARRARINDPESRIFVREVIGKLNCYDVRMCVRHLGEGWGGIDAAFSQV